MGQGYSLLPQLGKHSVVKAASISAIEMTMKLTRSDSKTTESEKSKQTTAPNDSTDTETEFQVIPGVTEMEKCAASTSESISTLPETDVTMATCPKVKRPGLPDFANEEEEGEDVGDKRPPPEGAVSESEGSHSEGKILGVESDFKESDHQDVVESKIPGNFSEVQGGNQNEAGNDVITEGDNTAKTATSGGRQKETRRDEKEADESVRDQILTEHSSDKNPIAPGRESKDFDGNQPADTERSQIARDTVRACTRAPDMGSDIATGATQAAVLVAPVGSNALEAKLRRNLERVLIRELRGKLSGDEGVGAIKGEASKIKEEAAKIKEKESKIKEEAAKNKEKEAVKITGDGKRSHSRGGVNRGRGGQPPKTNTGTGSSGLLLGDRRPGWRADGKFIETGSQHPRDFDDAKTKPETRFQRPTMTSSYSRRNRDDDDAEYNVGCNDNDDNSCHNRTTRPSNRCNAQQRRDNSKGMTLFHLDDNHGGTDGSLQRAFVRELFDGKLEIRRSDSFFLSTDHHRSRSKPVAMVQPRKVQGVRVLPQGFSSCPKRPRNIQRVPAIRAPRRQAQQEATYPSHEFQRVGMRLRGAGRTSGRRQVLPNWGEGSRQAGGSRRNRWKQGKGRETEDGNWKTVTVSLLGKETESLQAGTGGRTRMGGFGSLEGRSTAKESLLQAQKKEAEIAALLRHVQGEEREQEQVSERHKNATGTKQINFENSLGYFP